MNNKKDYIDRNYKRRNIAKDYVIKFKKKNKCRICGEERWWVSINLVMLRMISWRDLLIRKRIWIYRKAIIKNVEKIFSICTGGRITGIFMQPSYDYILVKNLQRRDL